MTNRSIRTVRLAFGVAVVGLLAAVAVAKPDQARPSLELHDAAYDAVRERIAALEPADPIRVDRLTVVPLRRDGNPTSTEVLGQPGLLDAWLTPAEEGDLAVRLVNPTSRPILATSGRVLHGSGHELLLVRDALVPAGSSVTADVLPTFVAVEAPVASVQLDWYPRLTPLLLTAELALDGTSERLDRLLAGSADAEAGSLRGLLSSDRGRALDRKLAKVLHDPAFRDPDVIGFAAGIDGRLVALHAFASPHLHRSKAASLLGSLGLRAEATQTRPHKEGEAADRAVVQATNAALHTLRKKSSLSFDARQYLQLRAPGLIGYGSLHGVHPIHLSVKPHDPKRDTVLETSERADLGD